MIRQLRHTRSSPAIRTTSCLLVVAMGVILATAAAIVGATLPANAGTQAESDVDLGAATNFTSGLKSCRRV